MQYIIGKLSLIVNASYIGWLNLGSILNIFQGVLKSANLLYKQGFDEFQSSATVPFILFKKKRLTLNMPLYYFWGILKELDYAYAKIKLFFRFSRKDMLETGL